MNTKATATSGAGPSARKVIPLAVFAGAGSGARNSALSTLFALDNVWTLQYGCSIYIALNK